MRAPRARDAAWWALPDAPQSLQWASACGCWFSRHWPVPDTGTVTTEWQNGFGVVFDAMLHCFLRFAGDDRFKMVNAQKQGAACNLRTPSLQGSNKILEVPAITQNSHNHCCCHLVLWSYHVKVECLKHLLNLSTLKPRSMPNKL